jgi:DNA-nicking Smr family endonuclease
MAKDVDLFTAAMSDVTPLKGIRRRRVAVPEGPPADAPKATPPQARSAVAPATAPATSPKTSARPLQAFDRDVDRALARGRRQPQASLDLHGMTLAAAERAVAAFLADSTAQGLRVVLIVTGKGLRLESGRVFGGRIRAEFPAWLDRPEHRARIAGVRAAHPRHGGSGAFYVLLRRRPK